MFCSADVVEEALAVSSILSKSIVLLTQIVKLALILGTKEVLSAVQQLVFVEANDAAVHGEFQWCSCSSLQSEASTVESS